MNAVSKLSNREKTIVRLRFGLGTPGRTGDDTEGSGKLSWNLPVRQFPRLEKIMRQLKKEISLHI